MKNKIFYIITALIFSFCFINYSCAEETDLNTMVQQSSMPSDEEIRATIKKFNFNKTQEEYLFKETKRRLEEMYSNQNFAPILNGETTLNTQALENEAASTTEQNATTSETVRVRKYSKHAPLTRRSKN